MGKRHAQRVLLVGWDAADWLFLEPLLAAGKMPALQALIERGVHGNLATIRPILSPMLWNSIATGKRADKHGILGFVEPCPDNSGIRPVTSTSRQCKALWNILSQSGMTSSVVNWFASHPAEPIRGTIVTDHYETMAGIPEARRNLSAETFHPASLRKALEPLIVTPDMLDAEALLPFVPNAARIDQDNDDRLRRLATLVAKTATVHAGACAALQSCDWDFMGVYYGGIDQFGHAFMPYHPPALAGVSEEDVELYGQVMEGCYRFHDMMLSTLLQHAGPETTVMLVSDHGFHHAAARPSADGTKDPLSWHRPMGVACLAGPGIRQGQKLYGASLLDVTPTILAALGLPVGADMDGRVWSETFAEPAAVQWIPTWETIDGDDGRHADELREDPVAAAEAIRQLVDLGYMDAPDEDVQKRIDATLRDGRINMALALTESRRAAKAIPLWEALLEEDELDTRLFALQLAQCHLKVGDAAACAKILDGLAEAVREHPMTLLLRAKAALALGDSALADELLGRAATSDPESPDVQLALGNTALKCGDLRKARTAFESARSSDTHMAAALDGLSRVALARNCPSDAVEFSLECVGLMHHFPRAHLQLAVALAADGQPDAAVAAAKVALQLAPNLRSASDLLNRLGHITPPGTRVPLTV